MNTCYPNSRSVWSAWSLLPLSTHPCAFSNQRSTKSGSKLHALHTLREPGRAFTLLEILVVISVIGVLAAISAAVISHFKPNVTASATRQLLDDVARARQLAIINRTTVYMVFVPTNFYKDPAYTNSNWTIA